MKIVALSAALTAGFTVAAGASATVPAWTLTKAAAQVKAKVRVPWCRVYAGYPNVSTDCDGMRPLTDKARAAFAPAIVTCTGSGARVGQRYRTFVCAWAGNNDIARGRVQVTVTGPATFRWRSL